MVQYISLVMIKDEVTQKFYEKNFVIQFGALEHIMYAYGVLFVEYFILQVHLAE